MIKKDFGTLQQNKSLRVNKNDFETLQQNKSLRVIKKDFGTLQQNREFTRDQEGLLVLCSRTRVYA